jgi:hypothetical protein
VRSAKKSRRHDANSRERGQAVIGAVLPLDRNKLDEALGTLTLNDDRQRRGETFSAEHSSAIDRSRRRNRVTRAFAL